MPHAMQPGRKEFTLPLLESGAEVPGPYMHTCMRVAVLGKSSNRISHGEARGTASRHAATSQLQVRTGPVLIL